MKRIWKLLPKKMKENLKEKEKMRENLIFVIEN